MCHAHTAFAKQLRPADLFPFFHVTVDVTVDVDETLACTEIVHVHDYVDGYVRDGRLAVPIWRPMRLLLGLARAGLAVHGPEQRQVEPSREAADLTAGQLRLASMESVPALRNPDNAPTGSARRQSMVLAAARQPSTLSGRQPVENPQQR